MNPRIFIAMLLDSTKRNPTSTVGGIAACFGFYLGWIGFRIPATETEWYLLIGCAGLLLMGMTGQDAANVLSGVLEQAQVRIAEDSVVKPEPVVVPKEKIMGALTELATKPEEPKPPDWTPATPKKPDA